MSSFHTSPIVTLVQCVLELFMLLLSAILVFLEGFITAITLLLPRAVLDWFTAKVILILEALPSQDQYKLEQNPGLRTIVDQAVNASSFIEMAELFNYQVEEHVVPTSDGYLLGVHRLGGARGQDWRNGPPARKPVVYLHHGLLMNSEVWISCTDPSQSVAFALADMGYDVWLGNNRGNKYSRKHISRSPNSAAFWDFGLDEFALYDIPDTIEYILNNTDQETLSYVGFSQGSAQAFAAFSIHPQLNRKVNAFIALAPAMAPPGINKFLQSLINASPSSLYMLFGNRIILKSAVFWQSIIYPHLFVRIIDLGVALLFDWKSKNISYARKLVGYAHLYSFTSVKSVVHWFQIIRSKRFQMYDDDNSTFNPFSMSRFSRTHQYPTRNIRIPIGVVYGMSDTLLDLESLLSELPSTTRISGVPGYEHLDMLWGEATAHDIIPRVVECLRYCSERSLGLRNGHAPIANGGSKHIEHYKPKRITRRLSQSKAELVSEGQAFL